MQKKFFLLSALILIIASIPRGIELLSGNFLFEYDQGLFFQAVKEIVVERDLTLIGAEVGGRGGFFQGPGWYYLLSIPFALGNGNPYGAMILMFVLGLLTVGSALLLTRKMFGWKEALAVGLLIAISPSIIAQSRFIWPPFPISLFTVLFLFFLFQVLNKRQHFLPLLTFIVGMMVHFEVATAGTLFLQLVILFPILFIRRLVSFCFLLLSLISFLFTLSPFIVFDLRNKFLITNGVLRLISGTDTQVYIMHMFTNHLDVFKYNFLSAFHLGGIIWPVLLLIMLYGSFLIVIKDKKQSWAKKAFVVYLLISPLTLFAVFMLYLSPMWTWWILELYVMYNFLIGVVGVYLWEKQNWKVAILTVFLLFTFSYISHTVELYNNDLNDYGGTHKIKGKLDAIDYIYQDAKGEPFGLLTFTPPVYTYAYDYLVWWYGSRKYRYIPNSEKKGIFYLLIEPDPEKPWSYKGWLETVIKTGTVLETKTLPSGFIIQKRRE